MIPFAFSQSVGERTASLHEVYHENSKLNEHSPARVLTTEQVYITSRSVRDSIGPSRPMVLNQGQGEFDRVLASRRSLRDVGKRIQLSDLSSLIWAGAGITGILQEGDGPAFALRTAPSGGGLYPIDLYVVANDVADLARAVYYFHPFKEELQVVLHANPLEVSKAGFFHQALAAQAAVIFLLVANFSRATWKYGERGYRLCLLDAGHLAENLVLKATELGCSSVPVAGFHDDLLASHLGIDGVTEAVVHSVLVGGGDGDELRIQG